MRLVFDRNFKFRGFSESLENIVWGTIGVWANFFIKFFVLFTAPLCTYYLIKLFRRAKPEKRKNQWNPLSNPIPFIIINLCWGLLVCGIVSGKAFKKTDNVYKPKTGWNFNDPNHHNSVADPKQNNQNTFHLK